MGGAISLESKIDKGSLFYNRDSIGKALIRVVLNRLSALMVFHFQLCVSQNIDRRFQY